VAPSLASGSIEIPVGYGSVELYNLTGRKVWSFRRSATDHNEVVTFPAALSQGILHARLIP
jgi:hypothetical protein